MQCKNCWDLQNKFDLFRWGMNQREMCRLFLFILKQVISISIIKLIFLFDLTRLFVLYEVW